jgi:uncharacterized caspase-like protein
MRFVYRIQAVLVLLVLVLAPSAAKSEARFALLIGNQSYNAKVGPLKNPHNDIVLIGSKLETLGFKVRRVEDADYRGIDVAIKRHIQDVQQGGEGALSFIYYSGHGAADPNTRINYLIPVDVANADDDDLWTNSIDLNDIVEELRFEAPKAVHYVIFDACRNELNLIHKTTKGLAFKGFVPNAFPTGVMVAYATAPGKTATDVGNDSGPYARALADEIGKPVEAMTMFRNVALRVHRDIGQDPWMTTSTLPEVYFAKVPTSTTAPITAQPNASASEAALAWVAVKDTDKIPILEYFNEHYKGTIYAELALARAQDLAKKQVAAAVAKTTSVGDESVGAGRPPQDHGELVRLLQQQLRRVGCLKAEADGAWGEKSRAAIREFARYAKLSIDEDEPTLSLFDAATAAKSRVCPLQCDDDEEMRDGRCVAKERPPRRREEERTRHKEVRQSAERTRRENPERPKSSHSGPCFGPAPNELVPCK